MKATPARYCRALAILLQVWWLCQYSEQHSAAEGNAGMATLLRAKCLCAVNLIASHTLVHQ